jgi:hypothetical protein
MSKTVNKDKNTTRKLTKDITPDEMRSWDSRTDRVAAIKDFVAAMEKATEEERLALVESPKYARTEFARICLFWVDGEKPPANFPAFDPSYNKVPIPSSTKFRVHESFGDIPQRQKKVVLILPPMAGRNAENIDNVYVWRCTYTPYETKK